MSAKKKDLSVYDEASIPSAEEFRFGIVVSEWNREITHALYEGCYATLLKHGADPEEIQVIQVPGSFELTSGAKLLIANRKVDVVICLGCVIQGETRHNEYINQAVASGLTNLGMATSKPCIFGVLTPNTLEQAKARAGGANGNKGVEAAVTAIRMAALSRQLGLKEKRIGFQSNRS